MQLLLSWTQLALYSHTLVLLCNATPQKLQIFLVPALKSADWQGAKRIAFFCSFVFVFVTQVTAQLNL